MFAFFDPLTGSINFIPRFFHGGLRVAAKGVVVLLAAKTILPAPELGALWRYFPITPLADRKLVPLIGGFQ
jgi:hypothetical protein